MQCNPWNDCKKWWLQGVTQSAIFKVTPCLINGRLVIKIYLFRQVRKGTTLFQEMFFLSKKSIFFFNSFRCCNFKIDILQKVNFAIIQTNSFSLKKRNFYPSLWCFAVIFSCPKSRSKMWISVKTSYLTPEAIYSEHICQKKGLI